MAKTWDDVRPGRVRLTIYRETWARGGRTPARLLSEEDGSRCCLGHLARDLGIPDSACLGRIFYPRRSYDDEGAVADPAIERYLSIAKAAEFVSVNDNPTMSDPEREGLLTEMFADRDVDVSFV